jgi:hypothetical protein
MLLPTGSAINCNAGVQPLLTDKAKLFLFKNTVTKKQSFVNEKVLF